MRKPVRSAATLLSADEYAYMSGLAKARGVTLSSLIRRQLTPLMLGGEERGCMADYDNDVEIQIPRDSRLAKFALLQHSIEDCETNGCTWCRRWLDRWAPNVVLSTDTFRLASDGMSIEHGRPVTR